MAGRRVRSQANVADNEHAFVTELVLQPTAGPAQDDRLSGSLSPVQQQRLVRLPPALDGVVDDSLYHGLGEHRVQIETSLAPVEVRADLVPQSFVTLGYDLVRVGYGLSELRTETVQYVGVQDVQVVGVVGVGERVERAGGNLFWLEGVLEDAIIVYFRRQSLG